MRKLELKSETEWRSYCKSGKKPADIPTNPRVVYAHAGWAGLGDWFGTGTVAPRLRRYRSFKKARAFVRRLGLRSASEWARYSKSGQKPDDIPVAAFRVYQKEGWAGMGDWLGTGTIAPRLRQYRSFRNARAFVRKLRLKSDTEWREYCKSGRKPVDIPYNPGMVYADAGWTGLGDWLGTGTIAPRWHKYRAFRKARAFARNLGFKSTAEWISYSRSGKKPNDIPAFPGRTYVEAGWAGMSDWLGNGRVRGDGWRRFRDARAYVRGLDLKSGIYWRQFCQSGRKPNDIPRHPELVYEIEGGLVCPIGLELAYLAAKQMSASVIVWDMETVPDLRGFAAAKGLVGKPDDDVRAEMGDKFPN